MNFACSSCGATYPIETREWVCGKCGGMFEIADAPRFDARQIELRNSSLWRYRAMLPLPQQAQPVSLGEGFTPLVETHLDGLTFFSKLDFLNPTGSFKDRGTTVLISAVKAMGVSRVVEDSSGNAAASVSAYAARTGIAAEIFVPAHASPAKLSQIRIYGAKLRTIEGPRENAARAVQDEARTSGAYYASHYFNPFVLAGMKTTAWEIWEQLGQRAPDIVIAPVGHGTNLLGLARGFQDLRDASAIEKMPKMIAAQAANIAPLVSAFEKKLNDSSAAEPARTVAEGIAISRPVHAKEILRALRETKGGAIAVREEEILCARDDLARAGLYVEPTSATAVAALGKIRGQIRKDDVVVVTLTGNGLKSPSQ